MGHSTLELEAFLARLGAHGIEHVADVRRMPRSRRHPHFTGTALAPELARVRIGYSHHPDLGGMRTPRPDSENRALREEAFRGYADHMRIAILCAEADPAHCHRRLIADALAARGATVVHIRGTDPPEPHRMSPEARASGGRVTYPAPDLFGADPTGG